MKAFEHKTFEIIVICNSITMMTRESLDEDEDDDDIHTRCLCDEVERVRGRMMDRLILGNLSGSTRCTNMSTISDRLFSFKTCMWLTTTIEEEAYKWVRCNRHFDLIPSWSHCCDLWRNVCHLSLDSHYPLHYRHVVMLCGWRTGGWMELSIMCFNGNHLVCCFAWDGLMRNCWMWHHWDADRKIDWC